MVEKNSQNDHIDGLFDRALSSYVPEEPLGLSRRVVGHVEEKIRSRRQRRISVLALAFASLCCVVLLWTVLPARRVPPSVKSSSFRGNISGIKQFCLARSIGELRPFL